MTVRTSSVSAIGIGRTDWMTQVLAKAGYSVSVDEGPCLSLSGEFDRAAVDVLNAAPCEAAAVAQPGQILRIDFRQTLSRLAVLSGRWPERRRGEVDVYLIVPCLPTLKG